MDHIRLCRTFGVWMALAAWSVSAPPAPGQTSGSNKHTAAAMAAMGEMPLIAPLFIQNGQMSTTVTIVSAMARATTVDVVLLDQTGVAVTQQTYPLNGHAQLVVKVGDLLQAAGSGVYMGSVKIETDAQAEMNMSVLGQVSITGTARGLPVYFEEEFPMAQPSDTGVFRATAPAVLGYPVLALRSTSKNYQTVTENCFYEHGGAAQSTLQLAPGAVALSGACGAGSASGGPLASLDAGWNQTTLDNKGAAGIEVTSTGGAGALCVYGFAISGQPSGPVYASLNFTDAGSVNTANTVFAGVPVGQGGPLGSDVFAPALGLTNFGTTPVKATVTLAVTGANGPNGQTLATLTVPGQSSATVPLGSMNGDPQLRNSITVQSNAAKGALYASMVVFGGTAIPSVQLLGRDSMQPYNGGAHPWTTGSGADSTLVMFNYSSAPQPFYVAISSGTTLWQQKYQLAALETKTVDIGSLIATQTKDETGRTLPAAATAGVAQWFTPNFGQGAGRLLVSQPNIGLARNFGCQVAVSACGTSSLQNSSLTIAAGSTGNMGPFEADLCMTTIGVCGGSYYMTAGWPANWTSGNASVASIPQPLNTAVATINGNSAGSVDITATPIPFTQTDVVHDVQYTCNIASQYGTATVYDPGPSNVSMSPTIFTVGTATPFTISGNNLGTNCPTLSFPFAASYTLNSPCTDSQITGSLTANAAGSGDFTLSSGGFGGQGFLQSPGQSQSTMSQTAVSATAPALTCNPATVNFGGSVTCTVTGASASQVSQWFFGNQNLGVDGPTNVLTWSGSMVTGGTVSVTAAGVPLTQSITVSSRSTFANVSVNPQLVPNGEQGLPTLTSPPSQTEDGSMGQSLFAFAFTIATAAPQSGPNSGVYYVTSFTDSSVFVWEVNPALTNSSDPFYQHQGPQGGSCWATISQIYNAVQAHEVGAAPSHYSEVQAALASNNPASTANSDWGSTSSINGDINTVYNSAYVAGQTEPPTNLPPNINYPPYATCQQ